MTQIFAGLPVRPLMIAFGLNAIWINISEIFRYLVFVMPLMRDALSGVEDPAPMNVSVFLIWGVWDTLLLAFSTLFWSLWYAAWGSSLRQAIYAGIACWAGVFGILWLGLYNMNLATPKIVAIALPLALFELVVAALITRWSLRRFGGGIGA